MPGFQRYASVHPFKLDRVLFFRFRSVRDAYTAMKRQRRYGTAVQTRITETVTETDERKRNAGNQA